jgi:hypothetical protein
MPLPDPGEDDGREQAVVFLEESGIDLDRSPHRAELNQNSSSVNYNVDYLI